ncbi:MAG TPA: hypothetical protein VF813_00900 [Anaerolineaceae bacterium]
MLRKTIVFALLFILIFTTTSSVFAAAPGGSNGFNQYGYNYTARIFNGTGASWAESKGLPADYLGINAPDKLVMKWNAEWDRGNLENWEKGPYRAWEDNEWNGKVPGGSGQVWHYKIVWVGTCTEGETLDSGGYCIWGQFAVIMDQGTADGIHQFLAHGLPTGYGAYFK